MSKELRYPKKSRPCSPEKKAHLSRVLTGRKFSEEHLAKLRANAISRRGISPSAETRAKQSIAGKKKPPQSLESRMKGAEKRRGKPKNFANPELRRQRLIEAGKSPELRKARSERALRLWRERTPEEKAQLARKIAQTLTRRVLTQGQLRGLAIGREKNKGTTHWNYKNGKCYPYPSEFRQLRPLVLKRDVGCCVICCVEDDLAVHHIDYNKQHNTLLNLVTLCRGCNVRAESRINKQTWPAMLRTYTESLNEKEAA